MGVSFTRKEYLEVWCGDRYISRHTSLIECGESASEDADEHGEGTYHVTIGGSPTGSRLGADGLPRPYQTGQIFYEIEAVPIVIGEAWTGGFFASDEISIGASGRLTNVDTPTPSGTIDLAVKRYDGGSGTTTFNGVVPFQPGQLASGQESNIALFNGASQIPIYVNALEGLHTDGSLKAVQVQTQLSVPDTTPIALTLKLATSPTAGSVTPIDPNRAWCRAATLLYCTDADHMCSSRVALMPLIPMDDSRITATAKAFCTTGFDGFMSDFDNSGDKGAGNANYNWCYGKWCQYLTTGDPEPLEYFLRSMHTFHNEGHGYDYNGGPNGPEPFGFQYHLKYHVRGPNGGTWDPYNDMDPDDVNSAGDRGENTDAHMDAWAAYYSTGSAFHRKLISQLGRSWHFLLGNSNDPATSAYNYRANEAPRYAYRRDFSPYVWCYLSGDSDTLSVGNGAVTPSVDYAPGGTWDLVEKVDQIQERSNDPAMPNDWQIGVWATSKDTNGDSSCAGQPGGNVEATFQLEVLHAAFLPYYNWIDADSRIGPGLASASNFVRLMNTGPHPAPWFGADLYHQAYCMIDPATAASQAYLDNAANDMATNARNSRSAFPYMTHFMLAWKYAYDGDTAARDMYDELVQHANPDVQSNGAKTRKFAGQVYAMAFHGAAWRAGAPALGYE